VKVLVTGAAGNIGSHVSRHLMTTPHQLRLLIHESPLPFDTVGHSNIEVRRADLSKRESLQDVCAGVDCVVHLAGVLFAPLPERFLPKTNVGYLKNLLAAAIDGGVRKFILVSFPHVEGETTPDHPAIGRMDSSSNVIHFRTRLEAERQLLEGCNGSAMTPVIFRSGIVYGREIKMVQAARWLLRHRLMAVWREPTWAHLIAVPDFLLALQSAIEGENIRGIYRSAMTARSRFRISWTGWPTTMAITVRSACRHGCSTWPGSASRWQPCCYERQLLSIAISSRLE
jgi:nucleoside-diphosphate-sugar epimerase